MDLRPINDQETKGSAFHLSKGTMLLCKSLQTFMDSCMTHRLSRNTFDLTGGPPIRDMDRKTNGRFQRLFQIMLMGRDRESLGQRHKATTFLPIYHLSKSVGNRSQRALQTTRFTLMPISSVSLGVLLKKTFDRPLFQSLHQSGQDGFMNLRGAFFEALNQTIDFQSRVGYPKNQAKVHRDLAQRIPPFFGCRDLKDRGIRFILQREKVEKSVAQPRRELPTGCYESFEILPFGPAPLYLEGAGLKSLRSLPPYG